MEQEYEPFGEDWIVEMLKWRKADLVKFLRKKLMEAQNTSTNKQSTPCCLNTKSLIERFDWKWKFCPVCGNKV